MTYRNFKNIAAAGIVAALASGGLAYAHTGATGIVKERMDLMASVGKAMKTITEMFQGEKPYDTEKIREAATFIASHGADKMTRLFPQDSIEGPSEALPGIWENWERFAGLARDHTVFATALAAAAENPRGMQGGGMQGGGMQGGGMQGSGMGRDAMGDSPMMGSSPMGRRNRMMGGSGAMPMEDPDALAQMPPDAAFARLTQTCSACHTQFRKKQ